MGSTALDSADVNADGSINLRFAKNDAGGVFKGWHRSVLLPGQDVNAALPAISNHLTEMGYGTIAAEDENTITDLTQRTWTTEVVSAFAAAKAANQL